MSNHPGYEQHPSGKISEMSVFAPYQGQQDDRRDSGSGESRRAFRSQAYQQAPEAHSGDRTERYRSL